MPRTRLPSGSSPRSYFPKRVRLSEFDYELPEDRIAQTPLEPRDRSRLLGVTRHQSSLVHHTFRDLPQLLTPQDVLVLNETRVSALRLFGERPSGGQVEVFLLRPALEQGENVFEALVRPGRKVIPGQRLIFPGTDLEAEALSLTSSGGRFLRFSGTDVLATLDALGRVPLPPYITAPLANKERYQTVYATTPGSAAAPTAGLHFTPELLSQIEAAGITIVRLRLEVGIGTFRPIKTDNIEEHVMHSETFVVPEAVVRAVNECSGRVIAVGTTALRALESAAQQAAPGERIAVAQGETDIFIRPGYEFRAVDGLITNFHQPKSSLLLLVAAFVGYETMKNAYAEALQENYRFLSFGDAMIAV